METKTRSATNGNRINPPRTVAVTAEAHQKAEQLSKVLGKTITAVVSDLVLTFGDQIIEKERERLLQKREEIEARLKEIS